MPSLSAVMPAYNEEDNIAPQVTELVGTLRSLVTDFEVIVVNDGSRDRTGALVAGLGAEFPQVRLVQHAANQGYGAALYSGFMSATKEWVFLTDSDRQFDLSDLNRLLPLSRTADIVAGYRAPRRDPLMRVLNGMGWSALVTLLFGYMARDIDCAFKLFNRDILQHIKLDSRGATFSAEFLIRAKRAGYRIVEAPVSHRPRRAGRATGARLDVIIRAFRELFRLRWRLWFDS
ncbi:MAG: glycosyltransferase family 2 protein [Chloroflexi bacterium]|nr:glycosyltransferase family 2 protein [Chloroflexota bacterium]MBI3731882.1 glycosyltransferase family 2 protein [Chloroflexota bacterium]